MSELTDVLVAGFARSHPFDAARTLRELESAEAAAILSAIAPDDAAQVLREMASADGRRCLEQMNSDAAGAILGALGTGEAVSILAAADWDTRDRLLSGVSDDARNAIRQRLDFPPGTAGRLMEPVKNAVPEGWTLEETRASSVKGWPYCYIIDGARKLVGVISLPDTESRAGAFEDFIVREPVSIPASMPLDTVRAHPSWRDFDVLPVVDREGRLVGTLRHKQVRRSGAGSRTDGDTLGSGLDALVSLGEAYCSGLLEVIGPMTTPARRSGNAEPAEGSGR